MTDRELMQQALRALIRLTSDQPKDPMEFSEIMLVMVALRERLAQPQRTHWEGCDEVHPECKTMEKNNV